MHVLNPEFWKIVKIIFVFTSSLLMKISAKKGDRRIIGNYLELKNILDHAQFC